MPYNIIWNSTVNEWTRPALGSCKILRWIGVYLCFAFIAGIVLNVTVLITLFQNKRRRLPIDVFIISLCFADLLDAVLGIPLTATSNVACRWLYGKYLCYYEGFITYFVGMIGLYVLTALSLNRYWKIVTPTNDQCVTFRTAYISVILSVLGGLFWSLPPIFGWNNYRLEGVLTSCSIYWGEGGLNVMSYNTLLFIFGYIIPLFIMVYTNICIYLKVRETMRNKISSHKLVKSSRLGLKTENMERRMAKTVFFIILTFTIAWTPYALVAFISTFFSPSLISPFGGTIPAIFAKSSIYFNPCAYILSNSQARSRILCMRKSSRSGENSDSTREKYQSVSALRQANGN